MGEFKHDGLAVPGRVVLAHEPPFALGKANVDPATRQIEAAGRSETLEPRVMQVLVALARAGGSIVTRDELINRCWDGRIVGEDAINRTLSRIRQVAADIGGGSFKIETVTKVGYRISAGTDLADEARQPARSVCVLPFVNMSGDSEQEYFSDGISEDITTDLSKVSALSVTARNTAFTFKGRAVDVREIARSLGVTHVLEGSVRKAGDCVRISAQLIDGATGDHIWAERYDRDLTDIFAIQDEISTAVVQALKLKLLPREREAIERRGTDNVEAYDFFLMARQYWIDGDFGDHRREQTVIRLSSRAIEIDPGYARAWALLALAQTNFLRSYSGNEGADDGVAAAQQALALDPSIAEAHLPMAWRFGLGGRIDECNAELELALRLDADSWEVNKEAARLYFRQGRVADSARLLEHAVTLAETDYHSWGMLAGCYTELGNQAGIKRCAEMLVGKVEGALSRNPQNGAALAFGVLAFMVLGQKDRADRWRERALLLDPENLYMRYNLAWPLLSIAKDRAAALAMLEPVLAKAGPNLISLVANSRVLEPIRADVGFRSLLESAVERVGLAAN